MSEIKELNDEELQKVNGGFAIETDEDGQPIYMVLKAGDCFQKDRVKIKVKNDYRITIGKTIDIAVLRSPAIADSWQDATMSSSNLIFSMDCYLYNVNDL